MIKKFNSNVLIYFSLLSLFLFQYYLFKNFINYEIINFYPADYDQSSYLMLVYRLFEDAKHFGANTIFSSTNILPTGILFPFQTLLSFSIFGANRFSALLPNFLYFIIMQTIAFFTAKKILGSYAFGFILLGLILTVNTLFLYAGGIADFRMDFIAFNLYSMLACFFLLSQNFLVKKWVFFIGITVILLVLMRFITFIYLLPIISFILCQSIFNYYRKNNPHKMLGKRRLIHLLLLLLIIIIFLTPFILITKNGLYQYYVISHLSEKAFRGFVHHSLWQFIEFYPLTIKNQHLGTLTLNIMKSFVILYLFALLLKQMLPSKQIFFHKTPTLNDISILSLMVICPIVILMLDPSVSDVVCGIVVVPFLLITVILFSYVRYFLKSDSPTLFNLLGTILMLIGVAHQWQVYVINREPEKMLQDSTHINKLYDDIGNYAIAHHWQNIRLSMDFVTDYLNIGSFLILYYETHGKYLKIIAERMGNDLFSSISKEQALTSLESSNVVVLTAGKFPNDTQAFFPGMQSISHFRTELNQYTRQHFTYLGHYVFKGYEHDVYVR